MLIAPLLQRPQHDHPLSAGGRQLVAVAAALARLLVAPAGHHPGFDQRGEAMGEDVRRDAQRLAEFLEARGP
jgi:hypothetical protein